MMCKSVTIENSIFLNACPYLSLEFQTEIFESKPFSKLFQSKIPSNEEKTENLQGQCISISFLANTIQSNCTLPELTFEFFHANKIALILKKNLSKKDSLLPSSTFDFSHSFHFEELNFCIDLVLPFFFFWLFSFLALFRGGQKNSLWQLSRESCPSSHSFPSSFSSFPL